MDSKVLISILGNNDYLECRHTFDNGWVGDIPVKYIQEDLAKYFCSDWDNNSEIRIFLTEDAKKKNWLDDGHNVPNEGLQKRLEQLKLEVNIKAINIPTGNNQQEIWEIFKIIHNSFRENEEVIIDITHAFRYLPLLLTILLNYSKLIKNIKVMGIYYAAFESLGSINEIRKIDTNKRLVPIFNLTAFVELQDWTLATFDYFNNTNTSALTELVKAEIPHSGNTKDKMNEDVISLKKLIRSLDEISNNIALCRGSEIFKYKYDSIIESIENMKQKARVPEPFFPLLDSIKNKIQPLNSELINKLVALADWCLNHKLYQQAITLLQESLITLLLINENTDTSIKSNREAASSSYQIYSEKIPASNWKGAAVKNKKLTEKFLASTFLQKYSKAYNKLTAIRNDVNHGGFLAEARNVESIKCKLENVIFSLKHNSI